MNSKTKLSFIQSCCYLLVFLFFILLPFLILLCASCNTPRTHKELFPPTLCSSPFHLSCRVHVAPTTAWTMQWMLMRWVSLPWTLHGQQQQQQQQNALTQTPNPQAVFSPDEVNIIIKESLDTVLGNQQYSEVKVQGFCVLQPLRCA